MLDDPYNTQIFPDIWVKVVAAESDTLLILPWTPATVLCLARGKNNSHCLKEPKTFKAHSVFSKENQLNITVDFQSCALKRLQRTLKQTLQDSLATWRSSKSSPGTSCGLSCSIIRLTNSFKSFICTSIQCFYVRVLLFNSKITLEHKNNNPFNLRKIKTYY